MAGLPCGQEMLEFAGNMLDRHGILDASAPGLLEVTGIAQHGVPSSSGLKDYDYQNLSHLSMGQVDLNQLATVNKIPIPAEVMEHFKHIKCHCMMGLFAEIGRAWLTIDSDIYIWTYENTRDVAYFDGLNHVIVSVGIVTPKSGVFVADVKHLLILATPVEIVVLGVTFGDSTKISSSPIRSVSVNYEEMQLINKPIFLLNTDNVAITTVQGTDDGRIFLGGRDGCLYEIFYQAESNWFGKRCKKINLSQGLMSVFVPGFIKAFSETDPISKIAIDNSRNLLYVLTEKGSIEAWDLGTDYTCVRRIGKLYQNDICNQAANILKSLDDTVFKPVNAICPLLRTDSPHFNLIAVTQCGVRFYFSTTSLQTFNSQSMSEIQRPHSLYLMHVRIPPGYTPNASVSRPNSVHSAFYSLGTILMMSSSQQEKDVLWSLSSEPFPFRQHLAESTTTLVLDGQVWAVADNKKKSKGVLKDSSLVNSRQPREVVLLTNHGAHIVSLLKPIDMLKQILLSCRGPQHDAVKSYFSNQSEVQACATAISIACMESMYGSELSLWAIHAFFLYGGEPHLNMSTMGNRMQDSRQRLSSDMPNSRMFMSTPYASRPASQVQQSLLYQTGNTGMSPTNMSFSGIQPDIRNMVYSAKHTALYLYLMRLLNPIWKLRCIDPATNNSAITHEDCYTILNELYAFKRFLENNPITNLSAPSGSQNYNQLRNGSIFNDGSLNGSGYHHDMGLGKSPHHLHHHPGQQKNEHDEVIAEEKHSLESLICFVRHTCEIMALWKILCEHQFNLLVADLPKDQQTTLSACIFRELIMFRSDICAFLIVTLINSYLNDNASLGSISTKLRDVCPTLYRHEDAVSHKATEILILSKNSQNTDDKDEKLRNALQLCKDAAPNLPLSNICQQFITAEFYNGVIDLSATCAAKIDPTDAAFHYVKHQNGNNVSHIIEDQDGFLAYNARKNCYKEIQIMLEKIYQNYFKFTPAATGSGGGEKSDGFQNDFNNHDNIVSQHILPVVSTALHTNDELLHYAVYEWLLSHDLLGRLLGIAEPSLGSYLTQTVTNNPDNVVLTDLLWKYFEKNGQHSAAAKILDNLASMQSNTISLVQRFEYLARAVMCMRNDTIGPSSHSGLLLKDLEDKLEIAHVQKLILDSMSKYKNSGNHSVNEAIANLNYKLYNMTELYTKFAEPFDLWECKIKILNCSHHNDSLLIESVWTNILENEMRNADTPNEKAYRIITKVKSLAQEYGTSGQCFPLTFLVRELELRCCKLRIDHYPIPSALIEMKIDVGQILDIYSRLISLNERIWCTNGDDFYLIKSVEGFTSILTKQPTLLNKNRSKIVAKIQDLTSACLSLLYTKPDSRQLIDSLRDIQKRIQRLA